MPSLFVALITPFHSSAGSVDLDAIGPHLRWLEANGIQGIVPCGTTGEGPSLNLEERLAVIKTCLHERGTLRVIAGTGCANLPDTIIASRQALEWGAEAAMVLPPFFFKNLDDAGLLGYYRAVCDAMPAGGKMMLYHIPPISQVAIPLSVIDGLMHSHPHMIYGLKDSGGDPEFTSILVQRYPGINTFTGGAPLFTRALSDMAAGGIFALANAFPRELRAILDGGSDAAAAQERMSFITQAVKPYGAIPALKALLPRLAGLPSTSVRAPLVNLTNAQTEELFAIVSQ